MVFNRKTLKKVIMTENYGCGKVTCWGYFIETVEKEKIKMPNTVVLQKLFNSFYDEIVNDKSFLGNNINLIENFFWEKGDFNLELDDATIPLEYRITAVKQIELYVNGKRFTKKEKILLPGLKKSKIKTALTANYVHALDAALVR